MAAADTSRAGEPAAASAAAAPPPTAAELVGSWRRPWTEGLLTPDELEQYWQDGYVIKHDVFHPEELQPVIDEVNRQVDELAHHLLAAGKITDLCQGADFYTRLTKLEQQFQHASVVLHKQGRLPAAFAQLWSHPRLLSAARQLLGDDVAGHPVWNLRCKTPQQEQATVPWHQDTAYLGRESWGVLQVTAWVPLLDATQHNGCMQVLQGGHRSGKTAKHTCCAGGTWYVQLDEEDAQQELGVDFQRDVVTCEVPLGGVLLLNNLVPHRSLDNLSSRVRWSLDLRWQRPDLPSGFPFKSCIPMCRAGQPHLRIDWAGWAEMDRQVLQAGGSKEAGQPDEGRQAAPADHDMHSGRSELDTTVVGPWMDAWPVTHTNRHVDAWLAGKRAATKA